MRTLLLPCALAISCALVATPARSQTTGSPWAATVSNDYRVTSNITYHTANNFSSTLDVYTPVAPGPHPIVLHIHGGGWICCGRDTVTLRSLPYLEMGFAVVSITYRLARVSEAPGAVEDCRCALAWVARNAKELYGFDVNRIVVVGYSAGGHLALMTGMLPATAGFDRGCFPNPSGPPASPVPKPAAIVNWYGITDVSDLLDGPNMRSFAVAWLGSRPDRVEMARRVSPMTYVRKDVPPILTIHGDADPSVPYQHATALHAALQKAGADTELVTIPGGKHGSFPPADQIRAVTAVGNFLAKHGIGPHR